MKKILILATKWSPDYWESDKEAPYPNSKYTELSEWDKLSKSCPLPGIGRCFDQYSDNPFVYLKIMGMTYDLDTGQPYFDLKSLRGSKTKTHIFENKLPPENKKLFSAIDPEKVIKILQEIGEEPPEEWSKLIEGEEIIYWKDYIGKYFLETETVGLSNNEFEDRTFNSLKALGFDVDQKGHTLPGEYADGIFSFDEYAVVYDCKNTSIFFPSAADKRAIEKYLNDERKMSKEKNIYPAFISKSFQQQSIGDIFCFTVSSLIYLLYKKIFLGSKFSLNPIKKILENNTPLTDEIIDKEWRE